MNPRLAHKHHQEDLKALQTVLAMPEEMNQLLRPWRYRLAVVFNNEKFLMFFFYSEQKWAEAEGLERSGATKSTRQV